MYEFENRYLKLLKLKYSDQHIKAIQLYLVVFLFSKHCLFIDNIIYIYIYTHGWYQM